MVVFVRARPFRTLFLIIGFRLVTISMTGEIVEVMG